MDGAGTCRLGPHTKCGMELRVGRERGGDRGLTCFICKNDVLYEVIGGIQYWGDGMCRPMSCW